MAIKVVAHRFEKYRQPIAFLPTIVLERRDITYIKPTSRLSIHFLWWHCGWWFRKDGGNDG